MNALIFRRYYLISLIVFSLLLLSVPKINAHPHSWVSVFTEVMGNDKQLTGLKMYWTFDITTTSDALSGQDLSEANRSKTLKKLSLEMLDNIKANHYFTHFTQYGKVLDFSPAQKSSLKLEGYKLTLSFTLPLKEPLNLPLKNLNLQVYEDSHYVDFLWLQQTDLQLSEHFQADCDVTMHEPLPIIELNNYDPLMVSRSSNSSLGAMSTQNVSFNCR